jgi:hypothetical protein
MVERALTVVSALILGSWIGCVPEARPEAVDGKNLQRSLYIGTKKLSDNIWTSNGSTEVMVFLFICSVDFYLLDCGCTSMCDRDY